ncbi:hypothetical protein [Pseudoflavonifractor phocaeensis]|uniref:hypothetical protein n=1 Tax=Pseudoflavonifractor phocaeensis TaxID=1870988 RepID=UPI00195A1535|nr:hypothetical protein [Pseudoflavonifractor phocaeensis]MBM6725200.1 hypothetical protein [Pseudoflavonifractor phocaeensis]
MSKHSIEKKAPESWRTPENIPPVPKFRTIVADPPWQKNQSAGGSYGGAIKYYDLMSLERVKDMPVPGCTTLFPLSALWSLPESISARIRSSQSIWTARPCPGGCR